MPASWRIRATAIALLLFGTCLALALPAAAQTRLWVQSDPGDIIGQGLTQSYASPADNFRLGEYSKSHIFITAGEYTLELVAPAGDFLVAGPYEAATRTFFPNASPGLYFTGHGRSCSSVTGRFVVLALTFDAGGTLTSLAVDFEQHCRGGVQALWGELRYNSPLPLTVEKPAGWIQPDPFAFSGRLLVPLSTLETSAETTIWGINAPASIEVINGEYSVNGGAFTAVAGTVSNRDRLRLRRLSSPTQGTIAYVTVTVGGSVSGSFSLTTYLLGEPQTGFVMESFPGDYVGLGESLFARGPDWAFDLSEGYFGTQFQGNSLRGRRFTVIFSGRLGASLAVGPYEEAARAPFANASPGLAFTMESHACNAIHGRFVILELDLAASPPRFAANFEQWCDYSPQPSFGEIRYNSAVPFNVQITTSDSQPDPMGLNAQGPVRRGSVVESNYTRIYGVNAPVPISITGGEFSLNKGPFTSVPGIAHELDLVQVRLKASPAPHGVRQALLDAGGTVSTFTVTSYASGTPVTGVYYRSSPGDYIGLGETRFHPSPPSQVVGSRNSGNGVSAVLKGVGGDGFTANFAAPRGFPLTKGNYEGATRFPFQSPSAPGLDFYGDGRGCSELSGRFVVHEADYNPDGSVLRFAADFEQRCENTGPPLYGQVRVNSLVPFSVLLAQNPPQDTSGEGLDDLVWQHADGRQAIWLMDGLSATSSAEILGEGTGWSIAHLADFDADGRTDFVWQHADGRMAIWLMDGTNASAMQQLLDAGSGWSVTRAADLNADGKADLIFANADGSVAVGLMSGTALIGGAGILGPGTGWRVARAGDFDGDGKADLLWTHTDGRVAIWLMDGAAVKGTNQILNAGSGWSVAHVADLNGDGRADIVWQHTDGSIAAWLMNGATLANGASILNAGSGWQVARTGDFDGDGRADLYFEHTDGRAAIWLMDGLTALTQTQILNPASGWSLRRLADLNGDGRADIVWCHADGRHAVWLMLGTSMMSGSAILGPATGWSVSEASP